MNSKFTREPVVVVLSSYAESLYNFRGELIRDLVSKGYKVFALAPDFDKKKEKVVRSLGGIPVTIDLDRNGINPFRDILSLCKIYLLLRKNKPEVFFGYFMKPVVFGTIAAWLAGTPHRVAMIAGLGTIYTENGGHKSLKSRFLRSISNSLYAIAFKMSNKVIFQNRDDIQLMIEKCGIKLDKICLVNGSGVNLARFSRPELQRPDRPTTFVWTGRMLREKGVPEIIEASELIRSWGFQIEVILVGGTDSNPGSLRDEDLRKWHDAGIVTWVGKVDDVRPYLYMSDVFLLPSYYREGIPRSILEAMASGLAVITTDAPGCRETVIDEKNGFLVPVRSVVDLANAMLRYVENRNLSVIHGIESRIIAENKFDVELINRHMIDILIK